MIKLQTYPKILTFLMGGILAAAFAPVFFAPALLTLAILAHKIKLAPSWKAAASYGFWFGFGFFTCGLYWMAIGVSVYADEFWWAIPFALFGLPLVLAIFISTGSALAWRWRESNHYILAFSSIWVFLEWVRSWIFTGLPWNLLGYSLAFSEELIQLGSLVGIYGMSFLVIYISAGAIDLTNDRKRNSYFVFSLTIVVGALIFGDWRLKQYPTSFSDIKIRIVQPNIPQSDKWDIDTFWEHLGSHVELSRINTGFNPDIILWSEAAVTIPYHVPVIKKHLRSALVSPDSILITGGVIDKKTEDGHETYSSMYAMNGLGDILFEYYKAHLVPFGEYIPLGSILPIKKLTPGLEDYTEGERGKTATLKLPAHPKRVLEIKPLICYEAIFSDEARASETDIIINVTNDTWYGKSSGPYQHFQMARMRAVENGVPLVRGANSGISAIIDPLGRIISETRLGHRTVLDGLLPKKINQPPLYSIFYNSGLAIVFTLIHLVRKILDKNICR